MILFASFLSEYLECLLDYGKLLAYDKKHPSGEMRTLHLNQYYERSRADARVTKLWQGHRRAAHMDNDDIGEITMRGTQTCTAMSLLNESTKNGGGDRKVASPVLSHLSFSISPLDGFKSEFQDFTGLVSIYRNFGVLTLSTHSEKSRVFSLLQL